VHFHIVRITRDINEIAELEDPTAQTKALHAALDEIPKAHRDTLQFLVFHLSRVIQHESDNLVCGSDALHVLALTQR
jgi:hypothetical protein